MPAENLCYGIILYQAFTILPPTFSSFAFFRSSKVDPTRCRLTGRALFAYLPLNATRKEESSSVCLGALSNARGISGRVKVDVSLTKPLPYPLPLSPAGFGLPVLVTYAKGKDDGDGA
ncbi:hypothetical protein HPP92_009162 [Vanilla planifolia]|uniref:Uncharacterized protein n=1 Tax=Vanilla planifolia TaxID=51239 RepID=A0A835RJ79_VANPL|nr:hypothetical protein HPP92_009162 [Vanilla planifolia]